VVLFSSMFFSFSFSLNKKFFANEVFYLQLYAHCNAHIAFSVKKPVLCTSCKNYAKMFLI
jgi:hypothetical protein